MNTLFGLRKVIVVLIAFLLMGIIHYTTGLNQFITDILVKISVAYMGVNFGNKILKTVSGYLKDKKK